MKESRLFKKRHDNADESVHDELKFNVRKELALNLTRKDYDVIESLREVNPKRKTNKGFSIATLPLETIQLRTENGLYVKISTERIQ